VGQRREDQIRPVTNTLNGKLFANKVDKTRHCRIHSVKPFAGILPGSKESQFDVGMSAKYANKLGTRISGSAYYTYLGHNSPLFIAIFLIIMLVIPNPAKPASGS
jgi:hypothetical protein